MYLFYCQFDVRYSTLNLQGILINHALILERKYKFNLKSFAANCAVIFRQKSFFLDGALIKVNMNTE
jgi:hypothetical protein